MGKDWTRSFEGMLTDRHARHNTSLPTRGKVTKKSTTLMKTTAKSLIETQLCIGNKHESSRCNAALGTRGTQIQTPMNKTTAEIRH